MAEQDKKVICSCCKNECDEDALIVEWKDKKLPFCSSTCAEETAEELDAYFDDEECAFIPKRYEAGSIPLRNIHDLNAIADDVKKWLGKRSADFSFIFECKVEGRDWRAEY